MYNYLFAYSCDLYSCIYSFIAKYPEQFANVLCLKNNSLTGERERVQYDCNFHSSDSKKMKWRQTYQTFERGKFRHIKYFSEAIIFCPIISDTCLQTLEQRSKIKIRDQIMWHWY